MTIEELYNNYVRQIQEVDKEIARLQGKRDSYNDIRLDLYSIIQEQNGTQEEGSEE